MNQQMVSPPRAGFLASGAYARQAQDSELIQYATEIRIRAQRRAGEMLAVTEKRTGGDAMKARSSQSIELYPPSLADMGITANQSSNWQALAAMPDEHFETAVATAKDTAQVAITRPGH